MCLTIAVRDSKPPVKKPSKAKIRMILFLKVIHHQVNLLSHGMMINSMMGGKTKAKTVLQTAPIKLSRRSSWGIKIATAKVTSTIKLLKRSSPMKGWLLANVTLFMTIGYIICIATKNWMGYPRSTPQDMAILTICAGLKRHKLMQTILKVKNYTHISSMGRFKVREGAVSSPYFQYPTNPNEMKIPVTKNIPTFSTPKDLLKFWGFFIAFCSGSTKAIPSNAKIVVPK